MGVDLSCRTLLLHNQAQGPQGTQGTITRPHPTPQIHSFSKGNTYILPLLLGVDLSLRSAFPHPVVRCPVACPIFHGTHERPHALMRSQASKEQVGTTRKDNFNITSAWAVDREFFGIYLFPLASLERLWPPLGRL